MMLVTCTPCSLFLRANLYTYLLCLALSAYAMTICKPVLYVYLAYLSYMTCNVPAAYAPYASGDGLSIMP